MAFLMSAYTLPRLLVGADAQPSNCSRACASNSPGSIRWVCRSASSRNTRSVMVAGRSREMYSNGPAAAATTRDASR